MKSCYLFASLMLGLVCLATAGCSDTVAVADEVVEASCGTCQLGLKGSGCPLAVRIDGEAYLVKGAGTEDAHEHAHDEGGICTTIRKAKVTGEVIDGQFQATSFELLPLEVPAEESSDKQTDETPDNG